MVFLLGACRKKFSSLTINNLNGGAIGCFGHAGMGAGSLFPENSLESLEACLNKGADGTEMDIQITKDSVLVIYHDDNLSTRSSCSGIIRDLDWNEISGCRFSSGFIKTTSLFSFDEFMAKTTNPYKYTFTFDCKLTPGSGDDDNYQKLFARTLIRTIDQYGLSQNVFIEQTDPGFLNRLKDMDNRLQLFLLSYDYVTDIQTVEQNKFYGISISADMITAEQVSEAHAKNIYVTLYGVNTNRQNYEAVEKQPDFIQTDGLNYLLKGLGKFDRSKGYLSTLFNSMN